MGDFDPAFVHTLSVQSWSLYSVGMFLIFVRIYARIHRLGVSNLQKDDYLMMVVAFLYTTLIVCLNIISGGGGSNLYLPSDYPTFTPQDIKDRVKGSKIVIVSEQAMLNVIYCIKACMLLMYTRLTLGLQIQRLVGYLAIYVACGWVATEIAFFTACRPFSGYWALPPPSSQCTTLQNYAIIQAAFNITSDTLMLFIPLPLITRLSVPLKQKSILLLIFSMGCFVIIAAILTKVFNLMNIWDPSYMLWYTREASVAVYVSNLPLIWPLMREWFPVLKGTESKSGKGYVNGGGNTGLGGTGGRKTGGLASRVLSGGGGGFGGKRLDDFDDEGNIGLSKSGVLTTITHKDHILTKEGSSSTEELSGSTRTGGSDMEMGDIVRVESWENGGGRHHATQSDWKGDMGITMTTTVRIEEEHVEGEMGNGFSSPSTVAIVGHGVKEARDLEGSAPKGFQWGFDHEKGRR